MNPETLILGGILTNICISVMAEDSDVKGFADFLAKYKAALPMERKATEVI